MVTRHVVSRCSLRRPIAALRGRRLWERLALRGALLDWERPKKLERDLDASQEFVQDVGVVACGVVDAWAQCVAWSLRALFRAPDAGVVDPRCGGARR